MPKIRRNIPYAFTPIPNHFIDFWMSELTHNQSRVWLVIMRFTWGRGKPRDTISISQIAKCIMVSTSSVKRALRDLRNMGMLITTGAGRKARIYEPQITRKHRFAGVTALTPITDSLGSQLRPQSRVTAVTPFHRKKNEPLPN